MLYFEKGVIIINITIDWLINNSQLNNLKCLASNSFLSNKIESVNILDNPDVLKWIKRNELVITTGYIFKDNKELQLSILRELKNIGCSGLGIKVKRFFETIPDNILKEAESIGLPIIEIPFYYSFSDISKIIYNELYKQQLTSVQNEYVLINKISNYYFENLGIEYIIKELTYFLDKTLLIIDNNYQLLSLSHLPKHNYILNDYDISTLELSNFSPSIHINSNDNSQEVYKKFSINNKNFNFYMIMLPNLSGSLCILMDKDETELSLEYRNLIKKIINIISLELEKKKTSPEHIHHHNFFFDYLMSNEQKTEPEIIKLCNFYGFDYISKRLCINFTITNIENDYQKKQIFKTIHSFSVDILCNGKNSFLCSNDNILSLFLFSNNKYDNIYILNQTIEKLHILCERLRYHMNCNIKIGVSRCHEGISSISTAFNDCIDAVNLDNYLNRNNIISSYNDQLPYHLLHRLSNDELNKLCTDNIYALIEFDKKNDLNLISILKMYYHCKFNSSETSSSLFIHRNTLSNRLEKIKSILNLDFTDFNKVFSIYLSICAFELLNITNKK